jgi:hypothetical protein
MLEDALERLDVAVSIEPMPDEARISGGLCLVHGKHQVYLSPHAGIAERIEILADALRRLDTETIWLPPVLRQRILGEF